MNVTRCFSGSVGYIGLVTVMFSGCASWTSSIPTAEDISQKRQERRDTSARRFDQKRDLAEFEAARARWEQGDTDTALEALQRLLARNPDHLEARLLTAELLLGDDRPSQAIAHLNAAIDAHPDDARLHHMMGLALDWTGQIDGALVYYQRARELRPNNEVYTVSYQTVIAASEQSQRSSEGVRQSGPVVGVSEGDNVDVAVRSPSETPPTSTFPGQESAEPLPQPSILVKSLASTRAHVSEPDGAACSKPPARFVPSSDSAGRAGASDSAEQYDRSGEVVIASGPEGLEKGLSAMSAGMGALALAYFQEAIALEPDDPQILISAAVSALQHNQPDVAVILLEPSLGVFADSAAIRRVLGAAYYRLGEYESSQVVLQQAVSLDKSSALSYFLMGCTLVKLGQPAAADTHFRQARRLDPRYTFRRTGAARQTSIAVAPEKR